MIKGTPGVWYSDNQIGGYFDKNGYLVVCEEYGLTDFDTDKYAIEVLNGNGCYDCNGKFIRISYS